MSALNLGCHTPRRALFSKIWELRAAALAKVLQGLQRGTIPAAGDGSQEQARELVRGAGPPLQRLLKDKVGSVLLGAQQVGLGPFLELTLWDFAAPPEPTLCCLAEVLLRVRHAIMDKQMLIWAWLRPATGASFVLRPEAAKSPIHPSSCTHLLQLAVEKAQG